MYPQQYSSLCGFFFIFSLVISIAIADDDAIYMSKLLEAVTPTPMDWSNNTHFCLWTGILCKTGRLYSIILPSRSLTGTLPSGLNSLTTLTHLNLQNNAITGPLSSLANLTALETVYLGHNNFTSISPGCFLGLTALRTLNLNNNSNLSPWTFPTELSQSSLLRTLELQATHIMGSLPSGIFDSFPSLQSVTLSQNNISGSLPESLGRSGVRYLRVDNQLDPGFGLTGTIDVIASMRYLSQAWLHSNWFTGSIPDLSNCIRLFDLQLRSNSLRGKVPASLMALPSLQTVSLGHNQLQGPIPMFSKDVKATWEENRFCRTDVGPCSTGVTYLLEISSAFGYPDALAVSGNDPCVGWSSIDCRGAEISTINLEKLNLSGTIPPVFANLTGLVNLILRGNNLTGLIPESLASLPQLELLDVSNNNLSGTIIPNFSSKVKLITTGNVLFQLSQGVTENESRSSSGDGGPLKTANAAWLRPLWITGASVFSIGVLIFIVIIYKHKRYLPLAQKTIFKKTRTFLDDDVEDFIRSYNLSVPKRYSYAEVKRITNSFRDKLGQGGYGVVYKARLPDGRLVAIKVISESKGNGEEFINEVASISKTSHVNIVSLLGFCYEKNKSALIYEFMANGSLDKFFYRSGFPSAICNLDWNTLYQITVAIARGLEYLHQGCSSRILHLDIKPQNILLDEDFCPKISDFGLAKICQKKESIVSILGTRGTIGYIAPEVFSRTYGGVSHKSDVYSYGMLILEMIGGRKNHDTGGSHTSEMYFPDWIYRDLEQSNNIANSSAISEEENDMVRKITLVSLWCIQINPSDRPSMSKVIEMLQGPLHAVPYPPKPDLYSPKRTTLQWSYVSSSNSFEANSISSQENGSIKSNEFSKDENDNDNVSVM